MKALMQQMLITSKIGAWFEEWLRWRDMLDAQWHQTRTLDAQLPDVD